MEPYSHKEVYQGQDLRFTFSASARPQHTTFFSCRIPSFFIHSSDPSPISERYLFIHVTVAFGKCTARHRMRGVGAVIALPQRSTVMEFISLLILFN
jgi:hypothetical protein